VHYLVTEVLFAAPALRADGLLPDVNWRAFIEVKTGAVLFLRAAIAASFDTMFPPATVGAPGPGRRLVAATGKVFAADPVTLTGADPLEPGQAPTDGSLDPSLTPIALQDIIEAGAGEQQTLSGTWVELVDLYAPNDNLPADPATPLDFTFPAVSDADNFTAVNAYYHTDAMFRMVDQLQMRSDFFPTAEAVLVDPVGMGNTPDAWTFGDGSLTRASQIIFGLGRPQLGDGHDLNIGNAIDLRVVLHEFCHALLWPRVHDSFLGFAHSAGDSLAAILNDPGSQVTGNSLVPLLNNPGSQVLVPKRFQTFPWIMRENSGWEGRFHGGDGRTCAAGWGWGGQANLDEQRGISTSNGYDREQILSTTLFRIYATIGGDPPNSLAVQQQAARYMAYLIIRAIGTLPSSTFTPTNSPDEFATALMIADTGTIPANNPTGGAIPGGSINKVIRWGFEQQGLYQPPGAAVPVTSAGQPPVDVYIGSDHATYDLYGPDYEERGDLWNRRSKDGQTVHEDPLPGASNYVYVRVYNRGYQTATAVVVRGYYAPGAANMVWNRATGWSQMTPLLSGPITLAPAATAMVGPFEWNPGTSGQWYLLMSVSASGDPSNIDPSVTFSCAVGPTPLDQLARFDNNIAVRTVSASTP
jgi:hypothetical protein